MTAPAFVSFRWFCCAGAASFHFLPSPPSPPHSPALPPVPPNLRPFSIHSPVVAKLLPPPPPDKVRHNEGAEFRSCPFLSYSDALCPKAGTGSGTGIGPEILSEAP